MIHTERLCAPLLVLAALTAPLAGQDVPSAEQIVQRYLEAVGGEETIRETKGMHQTGTMEMPAMGMSAQLEMFVAPPNLMLMKMDLPQVGAIRTGFDGEVGWVDNPMTGPMLMEGEQLEQAIEQADYYADLRYDERYASMETVEQVDFAGEPTYKVKLVDHKGKETVEYFSVESGLKIGFEGEQTTEMGTMLVVTELRDYTEIEGRMVPMATVSKMMGMEMTMRLDSVSFEPIDPSVFALPENIRTLVARTEGQE
ncbi:MAG TPA: hypothetical protein VMV46_04605 [Thermoanaerobaculia bacterium]|nr:hypothetical protein [Thermoanaerobaculia bacterium]